MRLLLRDTLVGADHLDDLPSDPVLRVQTGQRILEDHADLRAPDLAECGVGGAEQVGAVEGRAARDPRALGQSDDGLR
jgi:hypothetical protein